MLKVQCQCGHRMAVPDDFAGKRVKCAKCKGAVAVPTAAGAAASPRHVSRAVPVAVAAESNEAAPSSHTSEARMQRSRRHAMERKRKSHNVTVAIVAGAMVVLGLGLLLFIGSMNRPADPPASSVNVASNGGTNDSTKASSLPRIEKKKSSETESTEPMANQNTGASGEGESAQFNPSKEFTAGSASPAIAGTTATFDGDAGVTTIQCQPSPLKVGEKTLQMAMTVTHDGRDVRAATQVGALIRLTGDFTGLISGANSDEPRLTIEADGRDVTFQMPTAQGESDDRKGENGVVRLPKWVEYSLGKSELDAIAKSNTMRATLGGTLFDFSPEQLALFRAMTSAGNAKPAAPRPVENENDQPGASDPAAAPNDDPAAEVEKEVMDEKMMKMKK